MIAVVASNNKNKIVEIKTFLKDVFEDIKSLKDMNINIDIEETGTTFFENALIKAKTISQITNMPAIADDSGPCVDILDGAPGVYSARFAGEPCNDYNNNQKLLKILEEKHAITKEERAAHFTSCIVLYYPDGKYFVGQGSVDGTILFKYQGNGGFGYDPLFYCYELNKTFAEITLDEKNTVSHRARALLDLLKKL